jgi:hypothetical protein
VEDLSNKPLPVEFAEDVLNPTDLDHVDSDSQNLHNLVMSIIVLMISYQTNDTISLLNACWS